MQNWLTFKHEIITLGVEPTLVCTIIPSDNNSQYGYSIQDNKTWVLLGHVYFIVINNELVKIGKTDKSLKERFNSYKSGTTNNRARGTCSLTNFALSEVFRNSLKENSKIEIWSYNTPTIINSLNVLGEYQEIIFHTSSKYEQKLIEKFYSMFGSYPKYSINTNNLS